MMSKALLVVVALGAALVLGVFAAGCGGNDSDSPAKSTPAESSDKTPNPPKSDPDTSAFREMAMKACVDSAANENVPAETAEKHCDCAVDELVRNVNADEMAQIGSSGDGDLPPDVEEELMNAVLECIDKLME